MILRLDLEMVSFIARFTTAPWTFGQFSGLSTVERGSCCDARFGCGWFSRSATRLSELVDPFERVFLELYTFCILQMEIIGTILAGSRTRSAYQ